MEYFHFPDGVATALGTDARALEGAFAALALMRRLSWVPRRPAGPGAAPPDIQFDLDQVIPAPVIVEGVQVRFPPVHTVFATARLGGTPTRRDQDTLTEALGAIEQRYPWSPAGVFIHLAYGLSYFRRLPPGLLALHVPRLLSDTSRFVLEEAVPAPTDRAVRIEQDDLLVTLRGDHPGRLADVLGWLGGTDDLGGRAVASPRFDAGLVFTSGRAMFLQVGLPRLLAATERMPFAMLVNPRSPGWLEAGEPDAAAPAREVAFRGAGAVRYTTSLTGDYFDHGAIQHLAHEILDLPRFYRGSRRGDTEFIARVQHLFLDRDHEVAATAPVPHRLDGPGFDGLDVPGGERRPKNHYSAFVPSAAAFAGLRTPGLERFATATRRQNFLVPPRRHRAFPLLELA